LSFGEKILFLKKMKSSYWNKLFIELFSKEKNDEFSMNTWNRFFDIVRLWRNNASHTYHNFKDKNLIDLSPIEKNNKKIEINEFVLHLEKIYGFDFEFKKFLKRKNSK
ncbi:MAG: hypothetical protein K2N92_02985, partial [Malacoplasma sp.]|nr:hypothetical protein [Malacoplasma sp.]